MTVKIIGIVLIKNEDIYIEQILRNILDFCDKIVVADNLSSDETANKVKLLRDEVGKIDYHRIKHPGESHRLIEGYANSSTWIFAADGDEIYDSLGLIRLRKKILAGEYDQWWMILGNVLHCVRLNVLEKYAYGHLTPPCRSMTKLYNFSKITSWQGDCPERLHGGDISFKEGFSPANRLLLYEEMDWDISFLRCLHLCFMPRSSHENCESGKVLIRKNISDKNSEGIYQKMLAVMSLAFGKKQGSRYKREMYMRGPVVKKRIDSFFPEEL